jgi:hypothetical protein
MLAGLVGAASGQYAIADEWAPRGELLRGRALHTATVLEGRGSVLVVGGSDADDYLAHVEELDASGSVERAPLRTARHSHAAVALSDGDVLVLGGYGTDRYLASVERWDAEIEAWTEVTPMSAGRIGHAVSRLADGRVLVAGGYDNGVLAGAEIYDPAADTWVAVAPLSRARTRATATRLPDGRVVVAGGFDAGLALADVDVFDPVRASFTAAAPLARPRWFHGAAVVGDLFVVAGGQDAAGALTSVEIFDADDLSPRAAPSLAESRTLPSVVPRCDGSLLVVGGFSAEQPRASSETLDPTRATFSPPIPTDLGRFEQTAVTLPTCETVVLGGRSTDDHPREVEVLPASRPPDADPTDDGGCGLAPRRGASSLALAPLLAAWWWRSRRARRARGA